MTSQLGDLVHELSEPVRDLTNQLTDLASDVYYRAVMDYGDLGLAILGGATFARTGAEACLVAGAVGAFAKASVHFNPAADYGVARNLLGGASGVFIGEGSLPFVVVGFLTSLATVYLERQRLAELERSSSELPRA